MLTSIYMMTLKKKFRFILFLTVAVCLGKTSVSAAEVTFEYPELSVVPRATDQVLAESGHEADSVWKNHLPFLVPATVTFLAGTAELVEGPKQENQASSSSDHKAVPYVAMGVGMAWFGVAYGILGQQDFYSSAASEIRQLQSKTTREQLLRERRAEEGIIKAGSLARKLKWLSFASNLFSGILVATTSKESSTYFGIAAALTSLTPLVFPHRWEELDNRHQDYKKRIYAPVAEISILKDPGFASARFSPAISLSLAF